MTLFKQVLLGVVSVLLLVLIGTSVVNFLNTKSFLENQLATSAQDTANALALSLSSVENPEDIATFETMINSVFDGGYYQRIALVEDGYENEQGLWIKDKLLYQQRNDLVIKTVPDWFLQLVSFDIPDAKAHVVSGWVPIGTLYVNSHPGHAYYQLWSTFKEMTLSFLGVILLAILIVWHLLKIILRPLKLIERQAEAITNKELFIQDNIPNTIELKNVVTTMNAMVIKVKDMFDKEAKVAEKFRQMAYQDSVTGFSNRAHFELLVENYLYADALHPYGQVMMLRLSGLGEVNQHLGHRKTDQFIHQLAIEMNQCVCQVTGCIKARINGPEFVLWLPKQSIAQTDELAQSILKKSMVLIDELDVQLAEKPNLFIGITSYRNTDTRAEIMMRLDNALSKATLQNNQWVMHWEASEQQQALGKEQWIDILQQALNDQRFLLYRQSVISGLSQVEEHHEILLRMADKEGNIHPAGYFMHAAENVGLSRAIDINVFKQALALAKNPATTGVVALNMSSSLLQDVEFMQWLSAELKTFDRHVPRVAFEVSETALGQDLERVKRFATQVKRHGQQFGLDRFGGTFSDFSYLKDILPSYVKVDQGYTKGILEDPNAQAFLESLVGMSSSLGIDVIATAIESETQLVAMKALGISFFMGYHLSQPTAV